MSAMMDRGQEKTVPAGCDLSLKKKELLSSAMKRTSEWYASCPLNETNTLVAFMSNVHNLFFLCTLLPSVG